MAGAVVFDLDTLLDLGALSEARRGARWPEVRERIEEVVPYPRGASSLEVLELVPWARGLGAKVGVLTDLPGPIAEALLEKFEIECDSSLDASGGLAAGPSPQALEAAAERLGVAAAEVVAVGSSPADFGAAANAGACSAGVAWAGSGVDRWEGWHPDLGLQRPDDVVEALEVGAAMRPIAEVLAEGGAPVVHGGSLIRVAERSFAAGRHFSASDRRLAGHELTELVLAAKEGPQAAARLGEIVAEAARVPALPSTNLVVSVPGRPGGFDRFSVARAKVAEALEAQDGAGALEMVKTCDNYIDLDRDQRRMANHGRFRATVELQGETVLVIDDVITSGSQTRACERELLAAGAGEVWVLVAAASQDPLRRSVGAERAGPPTLRLAREDPGRRSACRGRRRSGRCAWCRRRVRTGRSARRPRSRSAGGCG
jgi:phosphoglycolate phosphatase-like HAD superfamily hydrolase/predicted amidophosphoribosyltransferase